MSHAQAHAGTFRSRLPITGAALGACALATASLVVHAGSGDIAHETRAAEPALPGAAYGDLPLRFEANEGQTDRQVEYLSRGAGYTLFLTPSEAVLSLRRSHGAPGPAGRGSRTRTAVVRMRAAGADASPTIEGLDRQPGATNYLTGRDRSRWRTGVPGFSRVRYRSVYPGIDLVYHGRQGALEYDFVVRPGADPRRIALDLRGAKRIALDRSGDLVLSTPAGRLRQKRPVLYQTIGGERRSVSGRYVMQGRHRVGFQVGRYDRSRTLVIDPVMVYSTYLGGSQRDRPFDIAVDSAGSAYVTGLTSSDNFPTAGSPVMDATRSTAFDIFVTKLNPPGSALVYSTYLGGSRSEIGNSIAVDSGGRAHVTSSNRAPGVADFPTTSNAYQQTPPGNSDVTLSVLNAQGSMLDYSTYLGGTGHDGLATDTRVEVDAAGMAYVAGDTRSTDFPTTPGGYQASAPGGGGDAFVAKINPGASGAASLVASTYLGGPADFERPTGLAIDATGVYVTGATSSTDFPTKDAFQGQLNSFGDGFVTKLGLDLTTLGYSTYLGGAGDFEFPAAIAVDSAQQAVVAGTTDSPDFPTANAFATELRGFQDGFVAKLDAAGSNLSYSTYLGGSGTASLAGVGVDGSGGAYVTGLTGEGDLPSIDPVALTGDGTDAFVARVRPDGSGLSFSSPLGGGAPEFFEEIRAAVDSAGSAYVTGATDSTDFPTVNPVQPGSAGRGGIDLTDAFVLKLSPDVAGAPYVTRVAPLSGPAGTRVTITGRGFTGTTAVRFGNEPAAGFSIDSHTQITAVAPARADGPAAVTVSRAAGTSPPNPITRFHYAPGTWRSPGAPQRARDGQTATMLRTGKLLVVGGDSAELYDPATGEWDATDALNLPRTGHTATLLTAPACFGASPPVWCGRVLVEGGGIATAELYDPTTGTWSTTGIAAAARRGESATLLPDGRVLVAGGRVGSLPTATAEIYDPQTGTWSPAAGLGAIRADHTATLITGPACSTSPPVTCGRIVVVGGVQTGGQPNLLTQLYDPATNTWRTTDEIPQPRFRHTATTLPDGRIMIVGGDVGNVSIASVQIYDPATETWAEGAALNAERARHAAVSLGDGRVLVAGGAAGASPSLHRTAEMYDPAAGRWRPAGMMNAYRTLPSLAVALLPDGDVLIADGSSAELFRPTPVPGAPSPPQTPPSPPPETGPPVLETPSAPAAPTTPARDGQRPVVRDVRVLDRSFEIGSLLPLLARRSRVGTRIQFTLSEPATVRLAFARARPGRRVGTSCRTATRRLRGRPRCTRYATVRPSVTVRGARAGANSVRFQGRLSRGRTLTPGRYRLTVTAVDAAGNRSAPRSTTFGLLRARRSRAG